MGKRKKVGLLLAVLLVVVSAGPVFAVEDELARGRTYSEQFLSGAVDELWAMLPRLCRMCLELPPAWRSFTLRL